MAHDQHAPAQAHEAVCLPHQHLARPVIDQPALTEALQADTIAGAALDVFEVEPVAEDDPIYTLPNVIPFNHMGTATEETRMAMRGLAVDNMLAVLRGETPPAIVNPEVLRPAT